MRDILSLVMTTWDRPRHLQAAIDSVLAQDSADWELCIRDDGSTDPRTLETLHGVQHPRVWVSLGGHVGRWPAVVETIARSTGEYLALIDSDDLLEPHAVATALQYLRGHPGCGWLYSRCRMIDDNGNDLGPFMANEAPFSPEGLRKSYMGHHLRVIRRSAYDDAGGYDGSFTTAADYDLMLRLVGKGYVPAQLAEYLYRYRLHPNRIGSRQVAQQVADMEKARAK